jgi:plastocyanin
VRRVVAAFGLLLFLAAPAAAKAPTTSVGVSEREIRNSTYRATVAPGKVKFNIHNFGEDTHNLVVRGPKGYQATGADVDPGDNTSVTVNLRRPGTYTLLCTKANHARLGMKTRIRVKRP